MTRFTASDFRSPSRSDGDVDSKTCVDLACGGGVVELRDSKVEFGSPADRRIRLSYAEFDAFQRGVRAGRTAGLPVLVTRRSDGRYEFRAAATSVVTAASPVTASPATASPATASPADCLVFDQAELDAFLHDIYTGRYDTRLLAAT